MQLPILEKKGYLLAPLIAIVVTVALLVILEIDSHGVHNEGLLEMDGNVAFDGGMGFDPDTNNTPNCPFNVAGPDMGDPDDCILAAPGATFDWTAAGQTAGVCEREAGGALDGYITEASPPPAVLANADVICQQDFIQTDTSDLSYHTGSDKDFQEIGGGGNDRHHCKALSQATNKADLLNAYFIVTTALESGEPHQIVQIGAERDSEHGDVFNGYWILQADITVPGSVTTAGQVDCSPDPSPKDFAGLHICGDVLVRFNYTSGGRIGAVLANEWVAPTPGQAYPGGFDAATKGCDNEPGTGDECTAAEQADSETHTVPGGFLCVRTVRSDCRAADEPGDQDAPGDDLCGRVNGATDCTIKPKNNAPNPPPCSGPGDFSTPWEPKDGSPAADVVKSPTFSEMGIDLTGLDLELPCIATLVAETRSSPSIDATLKDFVLAPTGQDCLSTIDTEIHNTSHVDIEGDTVLAGAVIHDQATVSPVGPASAPNATGTVTFHRFSTIDCTGASVDETVIIEDNNPATTTDQIPGGIPVNTDGIVESSDFTTTAGFLSYTAEYSGDGTYSGAVMPTNHTCEPLTIEVQPAIVTVANPNQGYLGDTLHDTATLSGGVNPAGSITFKLFPPGVDPCDPSSTPAYTETVPVDGNGNYSTVTGFPADQPGTWEWTASYSGDLGTGGANRPADSPCPDVNEQVVIIDPSTTLTKTATPTVVTTVVYDYAETNDGDVILTNPTVTDDQCATVVQVTSGGFNTGDVDTDEDFDPGETWNFTCTEVYNGPGTFTNVAVGEGTDPFGSVVRWCTAAELLNPPANVICDQDETDTRTVEVSVTVN